MNSSQPNPQLPTWIFVVTDLALMGAAAAIAVWSAHPLSTAAILWIVACVGLGALVLLVPLVANYERQKNEALDERQRALEALARTVTSSAEQISIATNGFHEVAELAQKNLRIAEHLPHKLQEKIAEFQAQLTTTADEEREELERELLALRTSESERLESVSQRIAKSAAEWTKLEAATQQHLTAANEAVAKLSFGTAGAIGKAQAAAEQALAQARVEAARGIGEASGQAVRAIEAAKAASLAELDARIAAAANAIVDRVAAELRHRLAQVPATSPAGAAPAVAEAETAAPAAAAPEADAAKSEFASPPPKRPRKVRREDAPDEASAAPSAPSAATPAASVSPAASTPAPVEEPAPIPASTIAEVTPAVPDTAEPFSGHIATVSNGAASSPRPAAAETIAPLPEVAKSRKRPARKPEDDEPGLGLDLEDSGANAANPVGERGITSDGATRLLVTAYIGIGNRLFIRGQGPGLSWEKGVPLQFVSIGKWRWETNDANAPVQFKLYKNDDTECTALGSQSLEPGHQQEVTAAF